MKFKKAFAVILAVAMVITLMPTMAFAATTNTVSDTYYVEAGGKIPGIKLNLEVTGNDALTGGVLELTLNNAEWAGSIDKQTMMENDGSVGTNFSGAPESIRIAKADSTGQTSKILVDPEVTYADKNSVRIKFNSGMNIPVGSYIILSLNLKAGDEAGEVTVDINGEDAKITNSKVTVAYVTDGATTASVVDSDKITTVANDGVYTGNTIKISENYVDALTDDQKINLILPKDYSWVTSARGVYNTDNLGTDFAITGAVSATVEDSEKPNVLTVKFKVNGTDNIRNILTIVPKFRVSRDAAEGDVTVDIENVEGDISEVNGLVIAENVVEAVEVTTFDELTTVQSGLMRENGSTKPYYVYVQLKENVADALENGRTVLFDFPEEVQVLGAPASTTLSTAKRTSTYTANNRVTVNDTKSKDASEFEWTVAGMTRGEKDTITFKVPVSVEAGFTGDIDVTVSGAKAGVEEQTVTVGTAVNPLTVEATTNDVKTGIQNQTVSAITLKETAAGMLQDTTNHNTVELYIPECSGLTVNKADLKAEVTEGDIEISAPKVNGDVISFTVKDSSRKEASTIVISGFTVSLDRVAAEGGYDLRVAGNAVVDNAAYDNKNFQGYSVAAEKYLNVITPANSDIIANKVDATFVVGESQYTNNGVTVAMDVASFIQNNRTYVPVRFLANALGVTDENIAWNEGARTVTLTGANTVVKLTVGSNVITTSTGTVTADVPVIVKDNRTYLPARFVANAFGADVAWDATTRTVTITR